jgi:hypothetical protein
MQFYKGIKLNMWTLSVCLLKPLYERHEYERQWLGFQNLHNEEIDIKGQNKY